MTALRTAPYVDKSGMMALLNRWIGTKDGYVCISRPRRFGKTTTADMLCAYYGRENDSSGIFADLAIAGDKSYKEHLNAYNVIFINVALFFDGDVSIKEMITSIKNAVVNELSRKFPNIPIGANKRFDEYLNEIYIATKIGFVIIIDEWDCVFRENKNDTEAQKAYLTFLLKLLKDQSYVRLAYMTGILPIKKYGTHSALSMFREYSMMNPGLFAEYVGFTDKEVKKLCEAYSMDFHEMSAWYDGYRFPTVSSVYSPRSVVFALIERSFDNYWTSTETFEALGSYINRNFNGLRESVVSMLAGEKIQIDASTFENDMVTFGGKDDILSLLIHLGYLGYLKESGEVFIPNKEIRMQFVSTIKMEKWTEVMTAINTSGNLLKATWRMDAVAVANYISMAHEETSHLNYSDENALSYVVSLAYYAARDYYTIIREMPTGRGYADMVFLPRINHTDKPAMVVELKWDKSAQGPIKQIKEKKYFEALDGHAGKVLLVGIGYDKKTKEHECVIEEFVM
jgi:hypothetical protein